VILVREASALRAVAPQFPPNGLTPRGFPGPVWVVAVSVTVRCGSTPATRILRYIFDASSGEPLIVSGTRCGPAFVALG
jgi:hypothetical protein